MIDDRTTKDFIADRKAGLEKYRDYLKEEIEGYKKDLADLEANLKDVRFELGLLIHLEDEMVEFYCDMNIPYDDFTDEEEEEDE